MDLYTEEAQVNALLATVPTNVSLYGERIYIDAEYLNVDGIIQSGKDDYTLTLGAANSYSGGTVINAGTLAFLPSATTTNVIGGLGGVGVMQHNGLGVTILGGDSSSFTGSATINTGTVQFATLLSLPTTANGGVLVNTQGVAALAHWALT